MNTICSGDLSRRYATRPSLRRITRAEARAYVRVPLTRLRGIHASAFQAPGDLVLDPTCGSGTTAFVAEQWGRRWITVDSSRVAAAIARQRLLTASFETYRVKASREDAKNAKEDDQKETLRAFAPSRELSDASGWNSNAPLNPRHGFHYKSVPHITLKSIAQNKGLDPIFARHEPILAARLEELNTALREALFPGRVGVPPAGSGVPPEPSLHGRLVNKLKAKVHATGARSVTDADLRRWLLPGTPEGLIDFGTASQRKAWRESFPVQWMRQDASSGGRDAHPTRDPSWAEWEVPFDTDPDWPAPLRDALTACRAAWRAKMDEVNACISANAEQEELVDQPETVRGVVRVSGPFTVESIRPPEASPHSSTALPAAPEPSPIGGAPEELEAFPDDDTKAIASGNAASHIDRMLELLRQDGITFLGNKHVKLAALQRIESAFLHAEGEVINGETRRLGVVIGPEFGSMPSFLVEEAMRFAYRRGFDDLVVAGFSFDAGAQEKVQENNDDKSATVRVHLAQIRPDVAMGDLLKKPTVSAQIFTVFGQPRTRLEKVAQASSLRTGDHRQDAGATPGEYVVHMEGVDIYDPVKNSIEATNAGKVAAWFVDTDYDGKVFCICQAFFPDKTAWEKLERALKGSIEEGTLENLSGTTSLPFTPGERQTVAVKVIDPRGNEVMRVHRLRAVKYGE